ncbi:hypothetical protein AB0L71_27825 [Streptomyces sp. NPDC052052]
MSGITREDVTHPAPSSRPEPTSEDSHQFAVQDITPTSHRRGEM